MKTVTATIRDAFGSAWPLLVILVVGLLVMPVAQWGTGQSGFMSGIILGVLLQTAVGVLFLARRHERTRGGHRADRPCARWRGPPSSSVRNDGPVRRVRLYQQASAATAGCAAAGPAGVADDAAPGMGHQPADHGAAFPAWPSSRSPRWRSPRGISILIRRWCAGGCGFGHERPLFRHPAGELRRLAADLRADHGPPSGPQHPAEAIDRHLRPGLAHRGDWPGVRFGGCGPAMFGFIGMGIFVALAWRRREREA